MTEVTANMILLSLNLFLVGKQWIFSFIKKNKYSWYK
mgnify:FL=1